MFSNEEEKYSMKSYILITMKNNGEQFIQKLTVLVYYEDKYYAYYEEFY